MRYQTNIIEMEILGISSMLGGQTVQSNHFADEPEAQEGVLAHSGPDRGSGETELKCHGRAKLHGKTLESSHGH